MCNSLLKACEPNTWGTNCLQTCSCGKGSDVCDVNKGCVCLSGWEGTKCDQDIDECTVSPDICGFDKICVNVDGLYKCTCPAGFNLLNNVCESKLFDIF